jgi:hypothetical protein
MEEEEDTKEMKNEFHVNENKNESSPSSPFLIPSSSLTSSSSFFLRVEQMLSFQ